MVFIDDLEHWRRICEVYNTPAGVDYSMSDVTDVISILNKYTISSAATALSSGKRQLPAEWFDCGQDTLMRLRTGCSPVRALFYLMEPSVFLKPVEGARRAQRYDRAVNDFFKAIQPEGRFKGMATLPRIYPLTNARNFSDMLGVVYVMNRLAGKPDRVQTP